MATDRASEEIQEIIDKQINLPSPPAIAVQILNTIQDEESSIDDLEKIISADPALTGKILKLANSAFYSVPNEVSNVARALSILGTNVIKNIALSFVIANDLRGEKNLQFDFDYFWKRSVTSAVAAELANKLVNAKDEDIFVTALLQDIGILTMYLCKGEEYATILRTYTLNSEIGLVASEQNKYHFDHQQLGNTLMESWGLPDTITTPIRYHHAPEEAPDQYKQTASILYVSNLISSIYSDAETSQHAREMQEKMSEFFEIDADTSRQLLDNVAQESVKILKIFDVDPGQMKPYSQMLQEANDELGKLNLSYEQLVLELKESKAKTEIYANELRSANSKLEDLAFRDGLTNLFNHRYFQETLKKEMSRGRRYNHPLSLILFDIDFFKKVNDTYGHPAGDQVLINLAQSIKTAVRPSDIIARYGGEEFAIILPETGESGVKVFAERLRKCVANITTLSCDIPIKVTISIGAVTLAADMTKVTQQDLIAAADKGLYSSKKNGRNRTTIQSI